MRFNLINAQSGEATPIIIKAEVPEFRTVEKRGLGWVAAGKNNMYFPELTALVRGSGIASACVNTKADYIAGDGFHWDETDKFQEAFFTKILQGTYNSAQTTNILDCIAQDLAHYEAFILYITENAKGQITSIQHIDFTWFRVGMINPDDDIAHISLGFLSADWKRYTRKAYTPIKIPFWKEDQTARRNDIRSFGKTDFKGHLLYVKKYQPGSFYYSQPGWAAADDRLEIDKKIGQFHAENIDNGFFPSTVVYMPGQWEGKGPDGKPKTESVREDFEKKHTGKGNRGKTFFTFGKDKDSAPQVLPFQQNMNDGMFLQLNDQTIKYIPMAFQVPPVLAGIQQPGELGNSQKIVDSIEMFQNGVIAPFQNKILTILKDLMPACVGYVKPGSNGVSASIKVKKPLKFIPPDFISATRPNERRELIGLPGDLTDEEYLKYNPIKVPGATSTGGANV